MKTDTRESIKQTSQQQSQDEVFGHIFDVHGVICRHKAGVIAALRILHHAETFKLGNENHSVATPKDA